MAVACRYRVSENGVTAMNASTPNASLLDRWLAAKNALKTAQELEKQLRTELVQAAFTPSLTEEGTRRAPIDAERDLKCVFKLNYTLAKADEVKAVLDAIAKTNNEGAFIAPRLVNWKPDLAVSEYRELDAIYKAQIDKVLTIKPGSPTLEVVPPKK
jgi:hypothetical protein